MLRNYTKHFFYKVSNVNAKCYQGILQFIRMGINLSMVLHRIKDEFNLKESESNSRLEANFLLFITSLHSSCFATTKTNVTSILLHI